MNEQALVTNVKMSDAERQASIAKLEALRRIHHGLGLSAAAAQLYSDLHSALIAVPSALIDVNVAVPGLGKPKSDDDDEQQHFAMSSLASELRDYLKRL